MTRNKCETCEHLGKILTEMGAKFVCRRNPPMSHRSWPLVNPKSDWCGEHQQRSGDIMPAEEDEE